MTQANDAIDSIREINLSYIMLAQQLLREDKAVGMFGLGLSKDVAEIIVNLSLQQVVKMAASNHLLCAFRFNDQAMLSALTKPQDKTQIAPTHAALLMAGQDAVQFA
jgi:flagellar transcriptional activator FlhD